jgi:hypothetical protein
MDRDRPARHEESAALDPASVRAWLTASCTAQGVAIGAACADCPPLAATARETRDGSARL